MEHTVVLNADYTFLGIVNWKRAVKLLVKEKAVVLKESDRPLRASIELVKNIPLVMRLTYMVNNVYRAKVPYSRKNVLIRDGHTCQYCGSKDDITIDHILPRSRRGKSTFLNCVASCKECNIHKKQDKTPEECGMKLRKAPHEPTIIEFLTIKMKNLGVHTFLKEKGVF
jgi:5-methylcytosine-specific restriction endonuclease McrA